MRLLYFARLLLDTDEPIGNLAALDNLKIIAMPDEDTALVGVASLA